MVDIIPVLLLHPVWIIFCLMIPMLNWRGKNFTLAQMFCPQVPSINDVISFYWNLEPSLPHLRIDRCVKNLTQLWIWPFYDHFSHFFTSYINIFHKTKVQTVILRCLTSLNLNWIKSYYMNHKRLCFSILEEKKLKI